MGQNESRDVYQELVKNPDGSFVVVSNALPEVLHFNPSESCVISYGIDKQTAPSFQHKTLSYVTVKDARQVANALVDVGAVYQENVHLYAASKHTECCTAQGMKDTFQKHASQVGADGLFVFHFSGHGISIRSQEWGLAPVDFDYTRDTYITADVLAQWLDEVNCSAKYILITLDCCYAGGIGRELTSSTEVERSKDLYVMSACMAHETSVVLSSLGNSTFTYFLSRAITSLCKSPGSLPISEVFSECQACCECLSSMLVTYSEQGGLQIKTMQPQMSVRNIVSKGEDFTDAARIGRFQYALELYNSILPIVPLDDKSLAYLHSIQKIPDGPLFQLERRKLLQGRVMESILCSLMYSIASIEVACNTSLNKVKNPNLSITAFVHATSAIDMMHPNLEVPKNVFFLSWMFFKEVLVKQKVKMAGTNALQAKILGKKDFNIPIFRMISQMSPRSGDYVDFGGELNDSAGTSRVTANDEDVTDSGYVESLVDQFYSMTRLSPSAGNTDPL